MKINKLWKWDKDDRGFYITPLIGFSWGEPYGKTIWFGWLRFLITFHFEKPARTVTQPKDYKFDIHHSVTPTPTGGEEVET